jgi:hypothetical protein
MLSDSGYSSGYTPNNGAPGEANFRVLYLAQRHSLAGLIGPLLDMNKLHNGMFRRKMPISRRLASHY